MVWVPRSWESLRSSLSLSGFVFKTKLIYLKSCSRANPPVALALLVLRSRKEDCVLPHPRPTISKAHDTRACLCWFLQCCPHNTSGRTCRTNQGCSASPRARWPESIQRSSQCRQGSVQRGRSPKYLPRNGCHSRSRRTWERCVCNFFNERYKFNLLTLINIEYTDTLLRMKS